MRTNAFMSPWKKWPSGAAATFLSSSTKSWSALCRSATWSNTGSSKSNTNIRRCANISRPREPGKPNSPRRDCALEPRHRDGVGDVGYCAARGLAADRDKFVGAMKIEQADFAEPRVDQNVGWIAGEARARNPALRNVERVHHRVCEPRRAVLAFAEEPAQIAAHSAEDARPECASRFRRAEVVFFERRLYREGIVDGRSAKGCVADEIDGDDNLGAKRAAERDRDGIDESAIEQPAPINLHWFENPRHGVGGP